MKTFVIPDIHGRFDLLSEAHSVLQSEYPNGRVIHLGDYIDRGPESCQVIDYLMAGPPDGWTWNFISGNHELMMYECHNPDHSEHDWWLSNGGTQTLHSYNGKPLPSHLGWIKKLPVYIEDEHRVYVHAGVSDSYELDDQPESMTHWYRYPKFANIGYRGKHVVHGHTPHFGSPEMYEDRTNMDTGAVFSGVLHVGVFDGPGGPETVLEITPRS